MRDQAPDGEKADQVETKPHQEEAAPKTPLEKEEDKSGHDQGEADHSEQEEVQATEEANGEDAEHDPDVQEPPKAPVALSMAAADARLRRICTPTANGKYKVPMDLIKQYQENRGEVKRLFERCGYDPDQGFKKQIQQEPLKSVEPN